MNDDRRLLLALLDAVRDQREMHGRRDVRCWGGLTVADVPCVRRLLAEMTRHADRLAGQEAARR